MDTITKKYDASDFSKLKGKSIYFRSKGNSRNTSIYFVNIYGGKCSPYVVEFDDKNDTVVEIKNHLVLSSCGEDYLNESEIELLLKEYKKYDICLLQVDDEGNVFMNPDKQDTPTLLRLSSSNSTPKDFDKYQLHKGNWYVRKK